MTIFRILFIFLCIIGIYLTAEEPLKMGVSGGIDIQAQKALWDNGENNNLDQLYGRINIFAKYNSEKFKSVIHIRAYPAGFGYEPLFGLELSQEDSLIVEKPQQIAKFQVFRGWAEYSFRLLSIRVGRCYTSTSRTEILGNYLINDGGAQFFAKGASHNICEFKNTAGPLGSSVMFGVNDKNLNSGYLRIREVLRPVEDLCIGFGYRGNVFDKILDRDAHVSSRGYAEISYKIITGLMPYMEFGVYNTPLDNDRQFPVLVGTTLPAGKILDNFAVEMEYLKGRTVNGQDKPLAFDLYIIKKLGKRVKFSSGLFSDSNGEKMGDVNFGLRFSSMLN